MSFDVETELGAVERSVSSLDVNGQAAHVVTLSRSYTTTVADVWDAVTSAERIPRWFLPVTGDLQLCGRYQLEGNAGGVITACRRLSHFALTWEFGGDVSWVEVRLSDGGAGRVRLTVAHTSHHSPHWDEFGPGRDRCRLGAGPDGACGPPGGPGPSADRRGRLRRIAGGQGAHGRQQRGVGPCGDRSRSGPRGRSAGRRAHQRVLYR